MGGWWGDDLALLHMSQADSNQIVDLLLERMFEILPTTLERRRNIVVQGYSDAHISTHIRSRLYVARHRRYRSISYRSITMRYL